jgi:hypothetical protein
MESIINKIARQQLFAHRWVLEIERFYCSERRAEMNTIRKFWKASLVALVALVCLAPAASVASAQRARVAVVYGGGFYGPRWYGPGWGWYGPGPGWYGPRYYAPAAGKVKIVTNVKGNSIYVDGGFAGYTGKLKKFDLRPGPHQLEVRDRSGHAFYAQRIDVLRGKTLEVHPDPLG